MQALRLYGANDLRLEDLPIPKAPAGGLVVKVAACAICGSDLRNVRAGGSSHGMNLPVTLGHELSGTIHALGEGMGNALKRSRDGLRILPSIQRAG